MQKLKRGTVTLAYEEGGTGDAAPMLFIHGWGCDSSYLAPQQAFFREARRTVAVNLRGHGASDAPPQDYTVAGFVDDLVWQCRQLGLTRPIVVGHSMGGAIALELAARHPDIPTAVILIDSYLFLPPDFTEALRLVAEGLRGSNYMSVLEQAVTPLFIPSDDVAFRQRVVATLCGTPQHVLASAFAGHLIDYDATSAATACTIPIAYIGAETAGADISRFRELCPRLKVGQTVGSGHYSPLLVPEQINAMLQSFERAYVKLR
jgi:pimeloyl-ACP methyl ester carboxylesterase